METNQLNKLKSLNKKEVVDVSAQTLQADQSVLLGTWMNTDRQSENITKARFTALDGTVDLQVWGACDPQPCDWGATPCDVYTDAVDSNTVEGLAAQYEFDFKRVQICGNVKQGILVLQVYNTFLDGSERMNYFSREFYHRVSTQ